MAVTGGYLEDSSESCEIKLKDGALDRVYGEGAIADPNAYDVDPL